MDFKKSKNDYRNEINIEIIPEGKPDKNSVKYRNSMVSRYNLDIPRRMADFVCADGTNVHLDFKEVKKICKTTYRDDNCVHTTCYEIYYNNRNYYYVIYIKRHSVNNVFVAQRNVLI